jgi:hypothetical protein
MVARPHRPETFAGDPVGAIFPPGSTFYKVTDRSRPGVGEYVTNVKPSTVESARRRLALPSWSTVGQVRQYQATAPVLATVGQVAGGTAGDIQAEVSKGAALEEVGSWGLPFDRELRLGHMLAGATMGAAMGLAVGYACGNLGLGLVLGLVIGLLLGILFPTDWTELFNLMLGPSQPVFLFVL